MYTFCNFYDTFYNLKKTLNANSNFMAMTIMVELTVNVQSIFKFMFI